MATLSAPQRPPTLKGKPVRPTGPRIIPKNEYIMGGYGEPPDGFLTGQNSLTEWIAYWALAKIFDNPRGDDVRNQPFMGGWPDWAYQTAELGGYVRALGSAVVDFVIYQGPTILGIRIQTERYHIFADTARQAYDIIQRANLEANGMTVVDIYDTALLGDPSGQKAIIAMKRAIGKIEQLNPAIARTAIRGSRLKVMS